MQRTSLPPIVKFSENFFSSQNQNNKRPMRVLEVACGTGRFMTFLRDNLPKDTEFTAIDLSPFYLEKAMENDDRYRGGKKRTKDDHPVRFVQAQAENLPFEDDSFDVVVCVYLFHELPRAIRKKVVNEMSRVVVKKSANNNNPDGGLIVLTDSVQLGDRPSLDEGLSNFSKMNEPYYADYVRDDTIVDNFESNGLKPHQKIVRSTTKSISFLS